MLCAVKNDLQGLERKRVISRNFTRIRYIKTCSEDITSPFKNRSYYNLEWKQDVERQICVKKRRMIHYEKERPLTITVSRVSIGDEDKTTCANKSFCMRRARWDRRGLIWSMLCVRNEEVRTAIHERMRLSRRSDKGVFFLY